MSNHISLAPPVLSPTENKNRQFIERNVDKRQTLKLKEDDDEDT